MMSAKQLAVGNWQLAKPRVKKTLPRINADERELAPAQVRFVDGGWHNFLGWVGWTGMKGGGREGIGRSGDRVIG